MGYYSTIDIGVRVREPEALREAIKATLNRLEAKSPDLANTIVFHRSGKSIDYLYWHLRDLIVYDDGSLEYEDLDAKWYGEELLVQFLAPFVTDGEITFVGEDGEGWGYAISSGKIWYKIALDWRYDGEYHSRDLIGDLRK